MGIQIGVRRFRLSSFMIIIGFAAVFSAQILRPESFVSPFSVVIFFFVFGMLENLWSLRQISDTDERRAFLVKRTTRAAFWASQMGLFAWRPYGILFAIIVVALLLAMNLLVALLKRRRTTGNLTDRLLNVLDYLIEVDAGDGLEKPRVASEAL